MKSFGEKLPGVNYVERPGAYGFILNERNEVAVIKTGHGVFLPGGGLDPGETEVDALAREIKEEAGFELRHADFLFHAAQYHWSAFYGKYFRKVGGFYEAKADRPIGAIEAKDHVLVWTPLDLASRELTQEFQRWAAAEFLRLNP